jgi:hypothetical protein
MLPSSTSRTSAASCAGSTDTGASSVAEFRRRRYSPVTQFATDFEGTDGSGSERRL